MKRTIPAVSIIIPMYNVEEYIGRCFDSILAQTFDDYEVIAVDDGSTDKTCEIVESFMSKFGDKLQLIKSKKNSDTPAVPRNMGISLSHGEYILFVDSDDAITSTALEEIYPVAKKFDADILYCEKYYEINYGEKFTTDKNLLREKALWNVKYDFVEQPQLISNNIVDSVNYFTSFKFSVTPWDYLIRRDFIIRNDIKFPNIKYSEDNFFILSAVCSSKKTVRVPNKIYIYVKREGSITERTSIEKYIRRLSDRFLKGVGIIDNFAEKFPPLKEHPELKYSLFEFAAHNLKYVIIPLYAKNPIWKFDELICREMSEVKNKTPLKAFLFSRMNIFNLKLKEQQQIISKQQQTINQLEQQLKNISRKF